MLYRNCFFFHFSILFSNFFFVFEIFLHVRRFLNSFFKFFSYYFNLFSFVLKIFIHYFYFILDFFDWLFSKNLFLFSSIFLTRFSKNFYIISIFFQSFSKFSFIFLILFSIFLIDCFQKIFNCFRDFLLRICKNQDTRSCFVLFEMLSHLYLTFTIF